MKRHGGLEGVPPPPKPARTGSYPPVVAARRRALGLPVTPAEHVAYEHGETREPPVTDAQMARTLAAVLPRVRPGAFRSALEAIAARVRDGHGKGSG